MADNLNVGGGQFGQGLGNVDALVQALKKRGVDPSQVPALSQISSVAPTSPESLPPSPLPGEAPNIISQAVGQATTTPKAQTRSAEMEISLRALADTVKTENKIAEASLGMR